MDCGDNNLTCEFFVNNPNKNKQNGMDHLSMVLLKKYDVNFENTHVYSDTI